MQFLHLSFKLLPFNQKMKCLKSLVFLKFNIVYYFLLFFSVFMWLLKQYLQYLLPIDEQRLAQLKSGNWFSGGGLSASSSSSSLSQMPTSPVTSPRRLLRPEVLAASSPLEHIPLRSGSIRTLYPRMLQFVVGIVNQLASLSSKE